MVSTPTWTVSYPAELPVSPAPRRDRRGDPRPPGRRRRRRDRVRQDHPAAEDLPRARGRGGRAAIGHTQPRRIAARSVAERIAAELGTELGGPGAPVGYQVRFTDRTTRDTRVKVMTDGILLAELQRDRQLRRYDTIIIDEAHERSLNIDFLLGYLKRLLPRRRDLKLVITSATIDVERFARALRRARAARAGRRGLGAHLPRRGPLPPAAGAARRGRQRPGRGRRAGAARPDRGRRRGGRASWPPRAPATCWSSCPASGRSATPPRRSARPWTRRGTGRSCRCTRGCPRPSSTGCSRRQGLHRAARRAGHQRRRDLADRARDPLRRRHRPGPHLALLRAHQGAAAADRADQPGLGRPALRAVAAASRPASRCGCTPRRTSRAARAFTDPEILRTNLASVILQMTSPRPRRRRARSRSSSRPDRRNVARRRRPARGARRPGGRGTDKRGRRRLTERRPTAGPAADRPAAGPDDPGGRAARLRARGAGDRRRAVAAGPARAPRRAAAPRPTSSTPGSPSRRSDFLTWLKLWRYLRERQRELSGSAFRRMCKREYLNYLRVREWQDYESQLRARSARRWGSRARPTGRRRSAVRRRRHPPGAAAGPALATSGCSRSASKPAGAAARAGRASTSAPAARGSRSSPAAC